MSQNSHPLARSLVEGGRASERASWRWAFLRIWGFLFLSCIWTGNLGWIGDRSMLRAFFFITLTLLLWGWSLPQTQQPATGAAVSAEEAGRDCCPGSDEQGSDCCDWDCKVCCAVGTAATLPAALLSLEMPETFIAELDTIFPLHLLHPHSNGPPPTPPPIG